MKKTLLKTILSLLVCFIMIFHSVSAGFGSILFSLTASAADENIYVSPSGNDSWSGTLPEPNNAGTDGPLKTVKAAKNKVKSEGISGRTVYFREGTYFISDTLAFTADDAQNTSYCAYNAEKAVFSGAYPVNNWKAEYLNGVPVWTAQIDLPKISGEFNTLYSGNHPLQNSRLPENGYFYANGADINDADNPNNATFQQNNSFYAKDGDVSQFYNINDIYVKIFHFWTDDVSKIVSFDPSDNKVRISRRTNCTVSQGDAYCLENVREALDKPGEWYIDKPAGKLYYIPFENETIDSTVLYAGASETLMTVKNANGLNFSGITFADTNWNFTLNTSSQAAFGENKCISVSDSQNVNFSGCSFKNIGAICVHYGANVKNCTVSACSFNHIGSQAVAINGDNNPSKLTEHITVTDNYISNYGEKREQAVAVFQTYACDCTISHNEIHSGPYTAISVGWTWGYADTVTCRNTISDNLIYDIGHTALSDMGGIYTLGIQNGTVISGNVIHDVAAGADASTYGGWGIYLDEGSSNIHVKNNLVYNCDSQGFHQHYGQSNQVYNNIFAFNSEGQVRCSRTDSDKPDYQIYLHNNVLVGDNNVMYQRVAAGRFSDDNNLYYDTAATKGLVFSGDNRKANSSGNYKPDVMKNTYGYYNNGVFEDPDFIDADNHNFGIRSVQAMENCGYAPVSFNNVGSSTFGSRYLVNTLAHECAYYPAQMWNDYVSASRNAETSREQNDVQRLASAFSALESYSQPYACVTVKNQTKWNYSDADIYARSSLEISGVSSGSDLIRTSENYVNDYPNTYDNTNVKAFARSKNASASANVNVDRSVYDDLSQTLLKVSGSIDDAKGRSMRYYCVLQSVSNYSPSFGTPEYYNVSGKTYRLTKGGWEYPFVGLDGGYDSAISDDNFGGMSAKISGPVPEKNESIRMRISGEVLVYSNQKKYYYCADNYIDLTVTGVDKGELRQIYLYCVDHGFTGATVTAAKTVLDSYTASQSYIDNAVSALKSTFGAGNADKGALAAIIAQQTEYSNAEYTARSWREYYEAGQSALEVLNDPFASQQDINEAYSSLAYARSSLVECRGILEKMTGCVDFEQSDYSQYAWYELKCAKSAAMQSVIDGTAEESAQCAQNLAGAISNLASHTASNVTVYNRQTLHKPMHAMTTTTFYASGAAAGSSLTLPQINFDDASTYDNLNYIEQFSLYVASKSQSASADYYIDRSIISDISETGIRIGADFDYITASAMRLYFIFVTGYNPTISNRDSITVNSKTYSIDVGTYGNPVIGGSGGANTAIQPPLENVKGKSGKIHGPVPNAGEKVTLKLAACTFNVNFSGDTYYCADNYIDFNFYGVDKSLLRRYAFEDYATPEYDRSCYAQNVYAAYETALNDALEVIYSDDRSQQEIDAAAQNLQSAYNNLKTAKLSRITLDFDGGSAKANLAVWRTVNYDSSLCGYPSHTGSNSSYVINDYTVDFTLKTNAHGYAFMPVYLYVEPGNTYTLTLKTTSRLSGFLAYNKSYSHGWSSFPQFYQFTDISYTPQPDGTFIYKGTLCISGDETVSGAYLRIEASNTLETISVSDISLTDDSASGGAFDEICYYGDVLFLPEAEKTGVHFAGWQTSGGETLSENRFSVGQKDETLKACWSRKVLCSDCLEIDYINDIIYVTRQGNISPEMFSLTDAECYFSFPQGVKARTGAEVSVMKNGKVYERYSIVLSGDVNCDGACDARDSVIINCIVNDLLGRTDIGFSEYLAADYDLDGEIASADVTALEAAGLLGTVSTLNAEQSAAQIEVSKQ